MPIQSTAASVSGFGDSITAGSNATTAANRWLNIVAAALSAGTIRNQGSSGTILQGTGSRPNNGLSRYSTALLGGNKSEMVFILYGLNDARFTGTPATTVAAYLTDYQTIISGLLAGGYTSDTIVIASPSWLGLAGYAIGGDFSGSDDSVMNAYRDAVETIAQNNNLFFADVYTATKNNLSYIDTDNIHPNDAGHAVIAAAFLDADRVVTADSGGAATAQSGGSAALKVSRPVLLTRDDFPNLFHAGETAFEIRSQR